MNYKLLIVCSANSGQVAPFIKEQVSALQLLGVETDFFLIQQKGFLGYLKERKNLLLKIKEFNPQLIHAHYGLSGLLANLQRHIPVITTYHGSDINNNSIYPLSRLNMILSAHNIFVSEKNRAKSGQIRRQSVIACGVDTELFKPIDKVQARKTLGLDNTKKLVLFAGAFDNKVKNPVLAQLAVDQLPGVTLLELRGYKREEVALLMNAVDVVLMTSYTEGSPQFIKEAMACNCPVVSVRVGDVAEVIADTPGCFLSSYEPADIATKLKLAMEYEKPTEGRKRILELGLDSETVASKIVDIYRKLSTNSTN